jgi:hypothetical protein
LVHLYTVHVEKVEFPDDRVEYVDVLVDVEIAPVLFGSRRLGYCRL